MHRQLAGLRDDDGRQIFNAHAGSARHDDDIRTRVQSCPDGLMVVTNQAGEIDEGAIAFHQCTQHRPVRIRDVETVRTRTGWPQFVPSDNQADPRPPDDAHRAPSVAKVGACRNGRVTLRNHWSTIRYGRRLPLSGLSQGPVRDAPEWLKRSQWPEARPALGGVDHRCEACWRLGPKRPWPG